MNTPVLIDWMTVVLGPFAVVALVAAFLAHRSAAGTGRPFPTWARVARGSGCPAPC